MNELYHHGVKGMHWGVRRYQNPDGTLTDAGVKRMKKKLKKSNREHTQEVDKRYQSEFRRNKQYNELGKESTRIAKQIIKEETKLFNKNDGGSYDIPDSIKNLHKRHGELDKKMTKIEIEVGKQYVSKFNEALLKDAGFSGDAKQVDDLIKRGSGYTMRYDGYLTRGVLSRDFVSPDDDYIRPRNL